MYKFDESKEKIIVNLWVLMIWDQFEISYTSKFNRKLNCFKSKAITCFPNDYLTISNNKFVFI